MTAQKQIGWLFTVLFLLGCGVDINLSDGVGAPKDPTLVDGIEAELGRYYVVSSKVNLYVNARSELDLSGWEVRSDAPQVFRVDRMVTMDKNRVAECTALSEGQAQVRLFDEKGTQRYVTTVYAQVPDRMKLLSHGAMRMAGRKSVDVPSAELPEARVLVGGTAVFASVYYRGAQRLFGQKVLQSEQEPSLVVENKTVEGFVVSDFFFLTPSRPGSSEVRLLYKEKGALLGKIAVVAVPESDVASLALVHQSGASWKDGDAVYVLAQLRDRSGREILGGYSNWTLSGIPQGEEDKGVIQVRKGDLFRYEYGEKSTPRKLKATFGALSAPADPMELSIQAKTAKVTDTTYLGCSLGRGGGNPLALLPLGLLLVPLLKRRRRQSKGSDCLRSDCAERYTPEHGFL